MEEKLNHEPGFVIIEPQQLVAVETEETKSMSQLTMEQLQLVPEHPYFPDGLDSDSDSDDSSDDEYELDLATISEFSELHTARACLAYIEITDRKGTGLGTVTHVICHHGDKETGH